MPIQCNNDSYVSSVSSVYGFIINQINKLDSFVPCIIGDFYFECVKGSINYDLFYMFSSELNLICWDDMLDGSVSHTCRHNSWPLTSLIDHVFSGECLKLVVINVCIVENGSNTSDHMPVMFDYMVPTTCFVHESARSQIKPKVLRWVKGNIAGYYQ